MRCVFPLALAALLMTATALMLAPNLQAQSAPYGTTTGDAREMIGVVVSSSSTELVIRDASGNQKTFIVDSSSSVPSVIKVGDRITVSYHDMGGSAGHVSSVAITPLDTLPSTAGPLGVLAIIGALFLGTAAGLRVVKNRRAHAGPKPASPMGGAKSPIGKPQ